MKTILAVASFFIFIAIHARAEIIAGPITNPANRHDYYLLTPNTWTASETEAENLGGTLAIIRNAAEQGWVFSKFGAYGGTNRTLWIGIYRGGPNRSFICVTGEKPDYFNWAGGQPDDAGGVESYVFMASANHPWGFPSGGWNDYTDYGLVDGSLPYGVVEVPSKSNEKELTEKEKALIGMWYESGNGEREAWITGTKNKLFLVTHDHHAARLALTPEGFIFNTDRLHGEIIKDKILWSNGTWWSREPSEYGNDQARPENPSPQFHSDSIAPD